MLESALVLLLVALSITWTVKVFRYFFWILKTPRFAASTPIPCVSIYSQRSSLYFWLFSPWLAPILEALPSKMGHWIRYIKRDFAWHHKGTLHQEELGSDVYWTVGPGGPNLFISDASIIAEVCHRWKDFSKQTRHYKFLNLFGPNVVSTDGTTWQRHRKITAPPFNEKCSSLVFAQSVAQGRAMLHTFTHDASNRPCPRGTEPVVDDLASWTSTTVLNVLSSIAYNMKMPWPKFSILASKSGQPTLVVRSSAQHHKLSFQESLLFFDHIPLIIALPKWVMRYSPFSVVRHLLICTEEFVLHIREMIASAKESKSKGDLLSAMVKAGSTPSENLSLSEGETIGNMFIFVVAGYESSSTALHTMLLMLACYPEIQVQAQKEVDTIWAHKKDSEDWCYETEYPKLRVLMAVILETLRLYPPIVIMVKATDDTPRTIMYQPPSPAAPIQIDIPPHTEISIDVVSTHRNPRYYDSPHSFLPSRWIMPASYVPAPNTSNEAPGMENMWQPPKGAFIAFSAGARVCLGKKFALVEVVGVLAALVKDSSIELAREEGESWEKCRMRALEAVDDRMSELVMQMRRKVKVRFIQREKPTQARD